MLNEMLDAVKPCSKGVYLDGTLGSGGYSEAILEASAPDGMVVGIDLDPDAVVRSRDRLQRFGERFRAVHGGFQEAKEILNSLSISEIDAAVLDLGLCSDQLDDPERGFSFRSPGPLDMRFDTSSGDVLSEHLTHLSVKELETILLKYGEERYFRKIARELIRARDRGSLKTTEDLAGVVSRLQKGPRGKIHPATRTFQALRIALNREMENLATALDEMPMLLKSGGRFCLISYHSLEDRQVKLSFRKRKKDPNQWKVITPKPLRPTREESRDNPRARSAKMRVLEAVSDPGTRPSPPEPGYSIPWSGGGEG